MSGKLRKYINQAPFSNFKNNFRLKPHQHIQHNSLSHHTTSNLLPTLLLVRDQFITIRIEILQYILDLIHLILPIFTFLPLRSIIHHVIHYRRRQHRHECHCHHQTCKRRYRHVIYEWSRLSHEHDDNGFSFAEQHDFWRNVWRRLWIECRRTYRYVL